MDIKKMDIVTKCITALLMAFISDLHLGFKNTSTAHIIKNLYIAFPDNAETGKLDYIFLNGDIFEEELSLSDDSVIAIQNWIIYMLQLCNKWNIKLRITEGTPLHDKHQSKQFVVFNSCLPTPLKADLRYHETCLVDYEEDDDIHVLYVPDKFRHDGQETWEFVLGELRKAGIKQVDYTLIHGMHENHIPDIISPEVHNSDNYLSITKKYIDFGHVHTSSVYRDRILTNGSFDRLRHREEEKKGFFKVLSHRDTFDNDEITFIVNKGAKPYITIDLCDMPTENVSMYISNIVDKLTIDSFIRLKMPKDEVLIGIFKSFRAAFPSHNWSILEPKNKMSELLNNDAPKLEAEPITAGTIKLQLATLMKEDAVEEEDINRVLALLE